MKVNLGLKGLAMLVNALVLQQPKLHKRSEGLLIATTLQRTL